MQFNYPAKNRVLRGGEHLTKKQTIAYVLILGFAMALIPFTIDPFLPAFPAIAGYFGVANSTIQLSLTAVTVGFALGQLVVGPLSDAYGRRRPLMIVVTMFVLSTMLVVVSPTAEVFILLRLLMGMSAAAATVIAQAMIRDLFSGMGQMKMLARTYLIQGAAPIVGPIIGSQVTEAAGWQALFWGLGLSSLSLLLANHRYLIETLPVERRRAASARGLMRGYQSVLKDRVYIGLLLFAGFQLSALFAYLNIVPFLYQQGFGLSEGQFGLAFAMNSVFSWTGVQIGSRLPKLYPAHWLLVLYGAIGIGVGLMLVLIAPLGNFWLTQIAFSILLFNFGSTLTSIQTIALLNHGNEAGTAASLLGVSNFTFTSVMGLVYGLLGTQTSFGVGGFILIAYAVGLSSLIFIVRPWQLQKMD